jgi:hypothetical protein
MDLLEHVAVVSADMAEDMDGANLDGTERGDFVLAIECGETRSHLHLRRGMDAEDVAEGLRALADVLEETR